ncbi:uracil-DNA glycosylase family protein [Helicobacter sp. 16-1353]|uniref:uracil-DNA glycosylase family protein n=1 Tax=Helicobacter sp. 16-1353 TaxID=2004996 RepID=UPI0015EF9736|nr:uracil-DNA glycosylase family protein [Helicobacter sp. 16-1353]
MRKLIGERYCESIQFRASKDSVFNKNNLNDVINNCNLCELSKISKEKILGLCDNTSKIAFVTLKPILPFSMSQEMIKNIANRVFEVESYSLLSIIKCNANTNIKDTHISICKEYIKTQLDSIEPTLIILFGADIAKYLLHSDERLEDLRGRILRSKNLLNKERDFIVTYAINDLVKNPSLKKLSFEDFKIAKEFLNKN